MKIRTAEINDTSDIISIWTKTNLLVPSNNPEEDIKKALSTSTSTILVAEIERKIIGTVMVGYDGHRGWIYYFAVEPKHQGKGYGKQLVQTAEDILKAQGAPKLNLMIRTTNSKVQSFYSSIGYKNSDVTVMQKVFDNNKKG
jgi:ribosomal protein S18 acetylase RimI-like enzyme